MRRFLAWTENLAALFLLGIALLIAVNVCLRKLFSVQIPDHFDFSKLLQAIALFWGFALTTYYGSHICVDIVWEALAKRGRRLMDIAATLVMVLFLAPTAWMTWAKVLNTGSQATNDLRLPLAPFYGVAAFGATAAAVLAALRLYRLVVEEEPDFTPPGLADEGAGRGS